MAGVQICFDVADACAEMILRPMLKQQQNMQICVTFLRI
jgi:hypothetical protein